MDTKFCVRCNTNRSISEFHKNSKKKDGLQTSCKTCYKKIHSDYYSNTPSYQRKVQVRNRVVQRHHLKLIARYKRRKGCRVCFEKEPIALDFHHLDPSTKENQVSKFIGSKKKMKEEIGKCVVLCANCHRKVHAGLIDLGP